MAGNKCLTIIAANQRLVCHLFMVASFIFDTIMYGIQVYCIYLQKQVTFYSRKKKSHLFFCPAILISSELSKCFLWRWPGSIWCPLQLLSSFAPITPHTWHLKATPHNWTQISLEPPLWTWSTVSRVDGLALSRWRHAPSRSTLPHHARSALSAVCCV